MVNLTGSTEGSSTSVQLAYLLFWFHFFFSPQVSQIWFLIHITSKLRLTSRECRCTHCDVLQKKTVFPGESFIFAIPPHPVRISSILQVNSGRFLVTSCLRTCIYCALMKNRWWYSPKVSLSFHRNVCWTRPIWKPRRRRFGSFLRFFPLLSSRFKCETFKPKCNGVYKETNAGGKRLKSSAHIGNIWGHFFLCYYLQVCVSSQGERSGLQSPTAVPTAGEKPGNSRFSPHEAQTWVGMAQLPSVSSHFNEIKICKLYCKSYKLTPKSCGNIVNEVEACQHPALIPPLEKCLKNKFLLVEKP